MTIESKVFYLPLGVTTFYRPEFANVIVLKVAREGMTYFRTSSDPVGDGMFLHSSSGGYIKFLNPGTEYVVSEGATTRDYRERIYVRYKY